MSSKFNIAYTDFIRTTEKRHIDAVHVMWKTIQKNGHISPAKYKGWYCVPDENFLTELEIKEVTNEKGEKNNFQEDLIKWFLTNENAVKPKKFYKILLDSITKEELPDVSVSRPCTRVHWGIKVPGDETQTIYGVLKFPEMKPKRFTSG
ncbi:tRNA synthetases class I (M) [Popillia japonica]|uniref:tRNA synthetases class I (M) n=1 Tax=Popillia japonica TaxID=7064 RepID=A0AAW1KEL9_POPJA